MLDRKSQKLIQVAVIDKRNHSLAPTNLLVANRLVERQRAIWIVQDEKIQLLQTKEDFKRLRQKIVEEENRRCYLCLKTIPEGKPATIDHVYPKSKNGRDERKNLRCCCKQCNGAKGHLTLDEFYDMIRQDRKKYGYINLEHIENLIETIKTDYSV